MSEIFITSDEHYGHENIIKYCKRPFANVYEMRDYIIAQHNKKVPRSPNVLTIHAGDMFTHLTRKEATDVLYQLNGKHAFIYGNHDELIESDPWIRDQFMWVKGENKVGGAHLLNFQNKKLLVSHFAQRVWERSHKGSYHVFGHSHQELEPLGQSFDIGVEGHDYSPWSLEEIWAKMETLKPHHVIARDKQWPGKYTE
jgi:calcineurin-like phosphoesterase family protein